MFLGYPSRNIIIYLDKGAGGSFLNIIFSWNITRLIGPEDFIAIIPLEVSNSYIKPFLV
jgi:hypothetical protein